MKSCFVPLKGTRWRGVDHHMKWWIIHVCRSQYSEPVNSDAGQDTGRDQMKREGEMPKFMSKLWQWFELKVKTTKGSLQHSSPGRCRQSRMDSSQGGKMALQLALCLHESEHCCYRDTSSSHSTNISSSSTLHRGLLSPSSTAVTVKDRWRQVLGSVLHTKTKSLLIFLHGCTVIRGGASSACRGDTGVFTSFL